MLARLINDLQVLPRPSKPDNHTRQPRPNQRNKPYTLIILPQRFRTRQKRTHRKNLHKECRPRNSQQHGPSPPFPPLPLSPSDLLNEQLSNRTDDQRRERRGSDRENKQHP